jgi:Uma2 family endonuclease
MNLEATHPRATYQDLLDAPDNVVAEILAGTLHLGPRPTKPHARASNKLYSTIDFAFDRGKTGPGGWIVVEEAEIHLHHEVVVPDIAGWRLTTLDHLSSDAYFDIRPDWVCEVLSPSTEGFDRTVKLPIYARERVSHVWFVNPLSRTLEVLELDLSSRYTIVGLYHDDDPVRAEPFEAIEFELAELWSKVTR